MKRKLLFILLLSLNYNIFAQITFEKGYFISNDDEKIECLIKNFEWKDNPTEIFYMMNESSESNNLPIKEIKEFGIYNSSKYIRSTVKIDRSSSSTNKLSTSRNPIFTEEQLFLKVLLEGKANLYLYRNGSLTRFFFKTDSSNIEQLVFKTYKSGENQIIENNAYKQQLSQVLKCDAINMQDIKNLSYSKKSLISCFTKYNSCNNIKTVFHEKKRKNNKFKLSLNAGLNNSSLELSNYDPLISNVDFESKNGLRVGIEAEFFLPFNKNKWSTIIEPSFIYYKSEITKNIHPHRFNGTEQSIKLDYKSIGFSFGIRHYFYLNKNSRLFLNGMIVFNLNLKSTIDFETSKDIEFENVQSIDKPAFGIGFNYKKISLEARYRRNQTLFQNNNWRSEYNTLSIILGLKLN